MAKNVLDHDHGCIDDQAEIDCADRQKIRRFAPQYKHGYCKKQGERDGRRDDHGAAEIAEEQPLHKEDQHDAKDHVVQHGARCDIDQIAAIIDPLDLDTRRQDARAVDLLYFGLDAADGRHALLAAAHQHDPLNDVVVIVLAGDAETRMVTDADGRDVTDFHRNAIERGDHRVTDLPHRVDQSDAADDRRLGPEIDGLAADIDIAVVEHLQYLRQCNSVGEQLVEIDGDVVSLGFAAPAGDVDDPRHRLEAALENPVLNSLEIGDAKAGRTDHPVSIDLADRAVG